jgi:hypothetical protein
MTVIMAKTEPRTTSRGTQTPGRAVASALDSASATSHMEVIKRFCKLIVAIALLSAAAVGVVALKSAIWISHFNY